MTGRKKSGEWSSRFGPDNLRRYANLTLEQEKSEMGEPVTKPLESFCLHSSLSHDFKPVLQSGHLHNGLICSRLSLGHQTIPKSWPQDSLLVINACLTLPYACPTSSNSLISSSSSTFSFLLLCVPLFLLLP